MRSKLADETGPARSSLYDSMAIKLVNAGITVPVSDFVQDVRSRAGFRASPRQIGSALEGLSESGQPIDAEAVADLVKASRGDRSQRQRRNAAEWQALGTALTLQNQDGTPEGQREFIGVARQVAGPHANDALLLQVSLILAGESSKLDPRQVGLVAKRLARSAPDLTPEQLQTQVLREHRSQRDQRRTRQKTRSSSASRRNQAPTFDPQTNKPGKRRWKPGGRRRKTITLEKPEDRRR